MTCPKKKKCFAVLFSAHLWNHFASLALKTYSYSFKLHKSRNQVYFGGLAIECLTFVGKCTMYV